MRNIIRHCEEADRPTRQSRMLDCFATLAMTMGLFFLFVYSAHAQDSRPPECRLLPDHKAQAGVAYEPGVDVHGNAVVPADVNAAPFELPDVVTLPLSVDLAKRLRNMNIEGVQLEAPMGLLEIHKNGRVAIDGQDWTPQVYALCGKSHKAVLKTEEQADGHTSPNTIKSGAKDKDMEPAQAPLPEGGFLEGGDYRDEKYK